MNKAQIITLAEAQIARENEQAVAVREGDSVHTFKAQPTMVWLMWGLGEVFWTPWKIDTAPWWAVKLRGEWDPAWDLT